MQGKYTAVIQQHGGWWIGWVEEIPGVHSQGQTREELLENLRSVLNEALEMNRAKARAAAKGPYEEVPLHFSRLERQNETRCLGGLTEAFLRGLGSVLEFFPPPNRFDPWRL